MSRPTEFEDVLARLAEYGPLATLVSVTPEGAPHVGTVLVRAVDDRLDVQVGSRTREHIRVNPLVSLTWLPHDGDYQLIVDGIAVAGDEPDADGLYPARIEARAGILHRLAGRHGGPTCRPLHVAVPR